MSKVPPFESCISLIVMVVLCMLILFVIMSIGLWGLVNAGYIDEYRNLLGYGLMISCLSATGIVYMTHLITNEKEVVLIIRNDEVSEEGAEGE